MDENKNTWLPLCVCQPTYSANGTRGKWHVMSGLDNLSNLWFFFEGGQNLKVKRLESLWNKRTDILQTADDLSISGRNWIHANFVSSVDSERSYDLIFYINLQLLFFLDEPGSHCSIGIIEWRQTWNSISTRFIIHMNEQVIIIKGNFN